MTITSHFIPNASDYHPLTASQLMELSSGRVDIREARPGTNHFAVHRELRNFSGQCVLAFNGTGNFIYLDQNCPLTGSISFDGDNARAYVFGGMPHLNLDVTVYGEGRFIWGFNTVAFGVRAWVHGGASLSVGADGLWSEGIEIRTSDHHSIIDLTTGLLVNPAKDILIGRRVWVGAGVKIMKGISIGDGSIVGIGSLVTKKIGSNELWAGFPAQKMKDNVSWLGSFPSDIRDIKRLQAGDI